MKKSKFQKEIEKQAELIKEIYGEYARTHPQEFEENKKWKREC